VNVQFLGNFGRFSPYERCPSTLRSTASDLQACWRPTGDATADHFRYRFRSDDVTMDAWSPLPSYKTCAVWEAAGNSTRNVTAEVTSVNIQNVTSETVTRSVLLDDSPPSLTGRFVVNKLCFFSLVFQP
jgi:hypothetical protein